MSLRARRCRRDACQPLRDEGGATRAVILARLKDEQENFEREARAPLSVRSELKARAEQLGATSSARRR